MSGPAIRVQGLGKQYHIGTRKKRRRTLYDAVGEIFGSALGSVRRFASGRLKPPSDTFWALKDVTFQVQPGEVIGIIGRNGAGKSTLLKILSRITEPTEGFAEIHGRVASLLEVGTGFHHELTGRENIFLNGAILGMRRAEIARKFDEIVAFSDVERFIDTPVKHYSSGMYLRLAFSVAAHLEPEILLVDEVFAVGDAEFQKRCLGKMGDVARQGRTVLFVSHNMAAVRQLCDTCVLLDGGKVGLIGPSDSVIAGYLRANTNPTAPVTDTREVTERSASGPGRIVRVGFENALGRPTTTFGVGQPFTVWFDVELSEDLSPFTAGLHIIHPNGVHLYNLRSDSQSVTFTQDALQSALTVEIKIPGLPLYPGEYVIEPWIARFRGKRIDHIHSGLWITLESQGVYASERKIQSSRGLFLADCEWRQRESSVGEALARQG